MRRRRLVVALGLALLAGGARAQPPTQAREEPPQFRTGAEVVVLDVVVRDRKGRTVRDLQPSEIQVFEDGVPQEPVSFRLQAAGQEPPAAAPGAPAPGARAGEVVHANLVTLVFDQLGPMGRPVARKAGLALARLADRPDLLVSVFQVRESLRLVQQFTTDRDLIEKAVEDATGTVNTQYTDATEFLTDAVAKDREAQQRLESTMQSVSGVQGATIIARLGRDADIARMTVDALRLTQSLQREQQGHSSLYSLLALSRQQQRLAGRKTILFFSEGIQVPPQLEHVLRSAISEANRANVSIYAVDARGLGDSRTFDSTRQTLQEAALADDLSVGDIFNGGAALSEEALQAFLESVERTRVVRRIELDPEQIPPDLAGRWWFGLGSQSLVASFHPDGRMAELFRYVGKASFKGLGDVRVWELCADTAGPAALARALGAGWFGKGAG